LASSVGLILGGWLAVLQAPVFDGLPLAHRTFSGSLRLLEFAGSNSANIFDFAMRGHLFVSFLEG